MLSKFLSVAVFTAAVTAHPTYGTNNDIDTSKWSSKDVIHKDVAIIGGGSSGTYAALSLKDKKVSCIVIEAKDRLGGHAVTYTDAETGTPINYAVSVMHNQDLVKQYFKRFNSPLTLAKTPAVFGTATYDHKTGKSVNARVYSQTEIADAMKKYAALISQWPRLNDGLYLPDPVPEVLAQPLGEVAKKYGFEAAVPTFYNYNPGLGDELTVPLIELMRVFSLDLVKTFATGFLIPTNVSSLYTGAEAELRAADSLLLSSWAVQAKRTDAGVKLVVKTPTGQKLIVAKKLLITIPPKVDFLKNLDLSGPETEVFSKFQNAAYFTSVVKNSGLPANLTIFNGQENTPYNFGPLPGIINSNPTGTKYHVVYYATPRGFSTFPYSPDAAKREIIAGLKALQAGSPTTFTKAEPEIVAFAAHMPYQLQVCPSDIKKGFYKNLYALQGLRSTFYSGAAWKGHDSSQIWKYTEKIIVPEIVKALQK